MEAIVKQRTDVPVGTSDDWSIHAPVFSLS